MNGFDCNIAHQFVGSAEALEWLNKGAVHRDLFEPMWREWFKLDKIPPPDDLETGAVFQEKWSRVAALQRGERVFYPHLNTVVSLLAQPEFVALRTARNRYKILPEEQAVLATKRVGIVGLSVGRSVAVNLAMERSCGLMRTADFDTLDLSNLNRIKAPITDLGIPKTHSLARELALIDPYLTIEYVHEGLTRQNMQVFMTRGGKLDLLIDECDNLALKVLMRREARKWGIPVIMDTSDRGMIDIERYDLQPHYPLFHGAIDEGEITEDWQPKREELVALFARIVNLSEVSERGKYSLDQIGKTITTWPQLASAVSLGAGAAAEIARKILLNQSAVSGRFYIDTDAIIPNKTT